MSGSLLMEPNDLATLYDDDSGGIVNVSNSSIFDESLVDRFEMFFHNCSSHKHCLNVTDAEIDDFCQYTISNDIDDKCCSDAISSVETYARVLLSNYYFIFNILLMALFGLVGVVSNIFSFVVLSHSRMAGTTTSLYLRALAASDLLLSFTVGALNSLDMFGFDYLSQEANKILTRIIVPTSFVPYVCRLNSILLVVAVTVERYIAICHPLKAQRFCTKFYCRIIIVSIFVIAIVSNMPKFFFLEIRDCFGWPLPLLTDFFRSPFTQIFYLLIFESIVHCLAPFFILVTFNILLVQQVRKSTAFIKQSESGKERRRAETQHQLTVMLVVIVTSFVICQLPAVIFSSIMRPLLMQDVSLKSHPAVIFIDLIRNFPVVLNAALNFFLYCFSGKKFRETFLMLFCPACYQAPQEFHTMFSPVPGRKTSIPKQVQITEPPSEAPIRMRHPPGRKAMPTVRISINETKEENDSIGDDVMPEEWKLGTGQRERKNVMERFDHGSPRSTMIFVMPSTK